MKLYGGVRMGDVTLGVTHFPDRKRPCLYYMEGNVLYQLAYFTNENGAEMFWNQLLKIARLEPQEANQ